MMSLPTSSNLHDSEVTIILEEIVCKVAAEDNSDYKSIFKSIKDQSNTETPPSCVTTLFEEVATSLTLTNAEKEKGEITQYQNIIEPRVYRFVLISL